jgi:hypothetical protein
MLYPGTSVRSDQKYLDILRGLMVLMICFGESRDKGNIANRSPIRRVNSRKSPKEWIRAQSHLSAIRETPFVGQILMEIRGGYHEQCDHRSAITNLNHHLEHRPGPLSGGIQSQAHDDCQCGDLTIRGVTRKVHFAVEGPTPPAKDPWGNTRVAISATTKINRKDLGLTWSATIEAFWSARTSLSLSRSVS